MKNRRGEFRSISDKSKTALQEFAIFWKDVLQQTGLLTSIRKKSGYCKPPFIVPELNFTKNQCSISSAKTERVFNGNIDWHFSGNICTEIQITFRILIKYIDRRR